MTLKEKTLAEGRFDNRKNSLNTIRLLAALSVMFGHACGHLGVDRPIVITQILEFFYGVPIFFAMSGYLIWDSVGKSPSFLQYAKKRFWRIYPELWVGLAVEILAIIVMFEQPIQWGMLALFTVTQGTFLQFWTPDFLRAYGCGTPNGSLWTICVLIQFYILVYFVKKVMSGKKTAVWLGSIGASVVIAVLTPMLEGILPTIIYKLFCQTILPYFWLFLLGAFISERKQQLIPALKRHWIWFAAVSALVMLVDVDLTGGPYGYGILRCTALIAAVLGFAYRFPELNVKTDISYGIYIYHMTVVNVMITLGFTENLVFVGIAMVISCILAYGSTLLTGKLWANKKSKTH